MTSKSQRKHTMLQWIEMNSRFVEGLIDVLNDQMKAAKEIYSDKRRRHLVEALRLISDKENQLQKVPSPRTLIADIRDTLARCKHLLKIDAENDNNQPNKPILRAIRRVEAVLEQRKGALMDECHKLGEQFAKIKEQNGRGEKQQKAEVAEDTANDVERAEKRKKEEKEKVVEREKQRKEENTGQDNHKVPKENMGYSKKLGKLQHMLQKSQQLQHDKAYMNLLSSIPAMTTGPTNPPTPQDIADSFQASSIHYTPTNSQFRNEWLPTFPRF